MNEAGIPEVLATLNPDGTRRWIRPRLSKGRFHTARARVAWVLMGVFVAIPFIRIGGRPLMLIDLPRRELTLFGHTFLPTDTVLLMLLLLSILLTVFLVTALFGRAWCGWACPQTVYMEFLYRPIERLIEGGPSRQLEIDRRGPSGRRLLKYAVFALVSVFVGNVFLAYFVGVETLGQWVRQSPFEHPAPFLVMAATSALMFVDFAYFREQMCSVACPYARLQSALLDKHSLITGYDANRGEPRGKLAARNADGAATRGDCIDCRACVTTCPAGIDIRKGQQLECIACAQCVDACDAIMTKIGKPRGLVRYSSQAVLAGEPRKVLRPRVIAYPLVLAVAIGLLFAVGSSRPNAEVTVIRAVGAPFTEEPGGQINNRLRVKIRNRTREERAYTVTLATPVGATLRGADSAVVLKPGQSATVEIAVIAAPQVFAAGAATAELVVADDTGFRASHRYKLLGPAVRAMNLPSTSAARGP